MRPHQASLLLFLAACYAPSVTVTPTKDAPSVPSKPGNCEIEFFEMETLRRPYEVLGELRVRVPAVLLPNYPTSQELPEKEAMRGQACILGADAVIGLHHALQGAPEPQPAQVEPDAIPLPRIQAPVYWLVGTAVRYRVER